MKIGDAIAVLLTHTSQQRIVSVVRLEDEDGCLIVRDMTYSGNGITWTVESFEVVGNMSEVAQALCKI